MDCKEARQAIVLDHYGELGAGEKERLEEHLQSCSACAADRAETQKILDLVSAERPATVPAFDRERAWQAIRSELNGRARPRRPFFSPGRTWAWAGVGIAAVLILGIAIGRFWLKTTPAPIAADAAASATASTAPFSVRPALVSHFDDLQPVLLDFANAVNGAASGATVSVDERLLRGLLIQNLLLRRALNGSDPAAVELLDDLDLILKEIVNGRDSSAGSPAAIRDLIDNRSILFRMQILKTSSEART